MIVNANAYLAIATIVPFVASLESVLMATPAVLKAVPIRLKLLKSHNQTLCSTVSFPSLSLPLVPPWSGRSMLSEREIVTKSRFIERIHK